MITRFVPPWATSSSVSQSGSAWTRSSASVTRSTTEPTVSPPRNAASRGGTPRQAARNDSSTPRRESRAGRPGGAPGGPGRAAARGRAAGCASCSTHELGRADRPRQPAGDDAVEGDCAQRAPAARACSMPGRGERDPLRVHAAPRVAEVRDLGVAHQVDAPPHPSTRRRARSPRPRAARRARPRAAARRPRPRRAWRAERHTGASASAGAPPGTRGSPAARAALVEQLEVALAGARRTRAPAGSATPSSARCSSARADRRRRRPRAWAPRCAPGAPSPDHIVIAHSWCA